MKSKKAFELSLLTLATLILIFIVIVVSVAYFSDSFRKFTRTTNMCELNGGECVSQFECENRFLNYECLQNKVCCTKNLGLI